MQNTEIMYSNLILLYMQAMCFASIRFITTKYEYWSFSNAKCEFQMWISEPGFRT